MILEETAQTGPSLPEVVDSEENLVAAIKEGYKCNPFWTKIIHAPEEHKRFRIHEGLVYATVTSGREVIGIPKG